jgi:hypothetical protein
MLQDKNWVVAPSVTPEGRGGDQAHNWRFDDYTKNSLKK